MQAPALRIPTVGSSLARPSEHSGGRSPGWLRGAERHERQCATGADSRRMMYGVAHRPPVDSAPLPTSPRARDCERQPAQAPIGGSTCHASRGFMEAPIGEGRCCDVAQSATKTGPAASLPVPPGTPLPPRFRSLVRTSPASRQCARARADRASPVGLVNTSAIPDRQAGAAGRHRQSHRLRSGRFDAYRADTTAAAAPPPTPCLRAQNAL